MYMYCSSCCLLVGKLNSCYKISAFFWIFATFVDVMLPWDCRQVVWQAGRQADIGPATCSHLQLVGWLENVGTSRGGDRKNRAMWVGGGDRKKQSDVSRGGDRKNRAMWVGGGDKKNRAMWVRVEIGKKRLKWVGVEHWRVNYMTPKKNVVINKFDLLRDF